MAEKIDIIDSKKAHEQLNLLIKDLEKTERQILETSKAVGKLDTSLSSIKSIAELTKRINKLEGAQKKNNKQLTEAEKTTKRLSTAKKKLANVTSKENTELQKVNATIARTNRGLRGATASTNKFGMSIKQALSRFVGFTVVSTLIFGTIRAFKSLANKVMEFDKIMVNLSAILKVNRKDLHDLERTIKQVAGASIKTSTEVAKLAETLVVLGKSKDEIKQLLKPVNDLSIGLESTSQEAGELLIMTMNAFGASSNEAKKYADVIAKMRTSSALDFQRIKDSLAFLAPVANVAGKSFEEAAAMLAVLVDNGIKASKAGRLTAASFLRLSKEGLTLEDAMNKVNEAQRQGVSETDLLAISTELFGVNSAAVGIILSSNRTKMAELTEEFKNANGALQDLTDQQLTSVIAKMTIMQSSWEKLVFSVENGGGKISKVFKDFFDQWTNIFDQLEKNNRTDQDWIDIANAKGYADAIESVNGQLKIYNRDFPEDGVLASDIAIKDLSTAGGELQELNKQLKEAEEPLNTVKKLQKEIADGNIKYGEVLKRTKELEAKGIDVTDLENEKLTDSIFLIKKKIGAKKGEIEALKSFFDITEKIEGAVGGGGDEGERDKVKIINTKRLNQEFFGTIKYLEEQIKLNKELIPLTTNTETIAQLNKQNEAYQLMIDRMKGVVDLTHELADTRGASFLTEADMSGLDIGLATIDAYMEMYGDHIDSAIDTTNRFFDNRIERLEQDREANAEYFDGLIDLASNNKDEQERLEAEKEIKDKELRKRQHEVAKKQAILNKGIAIAEIGYNLARTISAHKLAAATIDAATLGVGGKFYQAIEIPLSIALAAAQIASIVSQPVPKFKDGTGNAPSGLAIVGDGGKHEYIEDRFGNIIQTPKTDTLVNLRGGEKIHKDLDSLANTKGGSESDIYKATVLMSLASERRLSNERLEKVFDTHLKDLDKKLEKGIKRGFSNVNINYQASNNFDHSYYRNDTL